MEVNQTATQAIINKEVTGTFTLVKKNASKTVNLEGAKYRIWSEDVNYDETFTTDENGRIVVEGLKLGKYQYQEIKAPNNFLLDNNIYSFELTYKDQNTAVVYASAEQTNDEPTATITIVKEDSETGNSQQGDATLAGAIYNVYAGEDIYDATETRKIYSAGDLVATRETDKNGNTEPVTGLPLGKFQVKEEKSPEGYMIDENIYEVNLTYKDQYTKIITGSVTSKDKVKKMQVHIFKSGIKENSGLVPGLQGAEFTIKLYNQVEDALNQGYTYEEIWNGLNEYGEKVIVDENRVNEAQKIAPTVETITTDENGDAYTKNKLPYGKYWTKETKTPEDFYASSDFSFTISEDESEVIEIAKKVKHLYVNNEQMEAYIKLVKKDVDTGKIVTLNSTTFQIKASEDVYDRGNGEIIYKAGDIITQKIGSTVYDTFTTNAKNLVVPNGSFSNTDDEEGTVITPLKLPAGNYEVIELSIPEGYLELEEPIKFSISEIKDYDQDSSGDYIKTVEIENNKPFGTIIVDKSVALKENVDTSIINIENLSKIKFRLTAKENIIDMADGSIIYNQGQEIGTYNLDKNGDLKIENLPIGIYELQEIETIDGAVLNETKYEIKFEQKDNTTKEYIETREIENETTLVEISKKAVTGDDELEGAKLTLFDKDGNIVDSWISGKQPHTIEGLKVGEKFTLREDLSPLGFVKASDITFTIENTSEVQKITMIDKVVTMSKVDIAGEELEGAKMQVIDKDGNIIDEWTSSKEPHKINNLIENETYILREEVSINGYVKATDIEFTVSDEKKNEHIEMIDKIVLISKTDLVTGEELPGAELVVTDEDGNEIDRWISGETPHQVIGLEEGKDYVLTEITCPYGFEQAESINFTVTTDKETQLVEMKDMPILKNIKIVKKDIDTQEVIKDDFKFGIFEDAECTKLIKEIESDKENGTVTFENLRYGKFFIKETQAPNNYQLSDEILKIEINDQGIFINGQVFDEADSTVTFTYYNRRIPEIQTGNEVNYALLGTNLIISLAGIITGIVMIKRKKKSK